MKSVIDIFEGNHAILLVGGNEIQLDVPRELLPDDAKEGDWLNIRFELDRDETQRRRERVEGLLGNLKGK